MKKLLYLLVLCLSVSIFTGCVTNKFTEYYEIYNALGESHSTCASPVVEKRSSLEGIQYEMFEKGYDLMGISYFGGSEGYGANQAFEQGKKVGACVVVWNAEYQRTKNKIVAMPAYAYRRPVTTYGSASSDIYTYEGAFFAKLKNNPYRLGILAEETPITYKRLTDSQNGALVRAVVKGSPAYNANIFKGDIIVSVNDVPVMAETSVGIFLREGIENKIVIYRDGKTMLKQVSINSSATSNLLSKDMKKHQKSISF